MKIITLVSLIAVALFLLIQEGSASVEFAAPEEADFDGAASDLVLEQEEEGQQHIRVERSPGWRRRFRVRKVVRNVGRAARKAVKKVKHTVKKVGRKIEKGAKKLASKTKAEIKRAGKKLKGAAKKVKERVKSTLKKIPKKLVKVPGDLAKKLKDKLKGLVIKAKEEEGESVIIEPEISPIDPSQPTEPPKPGCNSACKFIKNALKQADFFKYSFCAFYTVRRRHRDFLIDRNYNNTLEYLITEGQRESINFYSTLTEVLQAENPLTSLESRQKVSTDCAKGKLITCYSSNVKEELLKLTCLPVCSGFTGCAESDKNLQAAIDEAFQLFSKTVKQTLTLLGV